MSQQYDNTNRGVLFPNRDRDPEDERAPTHRGSINFAGVDYWLSCWVKTDKNGNRYQSLQVGKPKNPLPDRSRPLREDLDDEIPY